MARPGWSVCEDPAMEVLPGLESLTESEAKAQCLRVTAKSTDGNACYYIHSPAGADYAWNPHTDPPGWEKL